MIVKHRWIVAAMCTHLQIKGLRFCCRTARNRNSGIGMKNNAAVRSARFRYDRQVAV